MALFPMINRPYDYLREKPLYFLEELLWKPVLVSHALGTLSGKYRREEHDEVPV
jgi:hypothetical protein